MSIKVVCACGKELEAPDDKAGLRGRCPFCRAVIVMPELARQIPLVGRTDIENSTAGFGASDELDRRAFAAGTSTGYRRRKAWDQGGLNTYGKPSPPRAEDSTAEKEARIAWAREILDRSIAERGGSGNPNEGGYTAGPSLGDHPAGRKPGEVLSTGFSQKRFPSTPGPASGPAEPSQAPDPHRDCPHCQKPIEPPPKHRRKCPHCREWLMIRPCGLVTPTEAGRLDLIQRALRTADSQLLPSITVGPPGKRFTFREETAFMPAEPPDMIPYSGASCPAVYVNGSSMVGPSIEQWHSIVRSAAAGTFSGFRQLGRSEHKFGTYGRFALPANSRICGAMIGPGEQCQNPSPPGGRCKLHPLGGAKKKRSK